jgi:precorrin-4 methylase
MKEHGETLESFNPLNTENLVLGAVAGSFKIGKTVVRFGKGDNQIYHAFRHTDELGLDRVNCSIFCFSSLSNNFIKN